MTTDSRQQLELLDQEERTEILRLAEEHKWTTDEILKTVELKYRAKFKAIVLPPTT